MIEAGQDFLTVKEVINEGDGKPDLLVTMDYAKVVSVGKPAVGKLLEKLQIYKATGNAVEGKKMYAHYRTYQNYHGRCR